MAYFKISKANGIEWALSVEEFWGIFLILLTLILGTMAMIGVLRHA